MKNTTFFKPGLFCVVSGLAFLIGCGQDDSPFSTRDAAGFSGKVTGQIKDHGGRVLSGALVTVLPGGKTTVSIPDGSFELSELKAGTYRLVVQREDFQDTILADSVKVGLLETRSIDPLKMTYRYATVVGKVLDSNGLPLYEASVVVENQTSIAHVTSDGKFVLGRVEPGKVRLFTAITGKGYGIIDTVLSADDTLRGIMLRLGRLGGTVTGKLVDASGSGIANAGVSAVGGALKTTTDQEGAFALTQVPGNASVILAVDKDGQKQALTGVQVAEGGKADLSNIRFADPVPAGKVTIKPGVAFAVTTDLRITVVADTVGRDTSFHVLKWLWSRDAGHSWDTTATNVWSRSQAELKWAEGDHSIQVRAQSTLGLLTDPVTQVVRLQLPPDTARPTITRTRPLSDTTFGWRDSNNVKVAWTVTDNRKLDSVWINDLPIPSNGFGLYEQNLSLKPGQTIAKIRAMDHAGNFRRDSLFLSLQARPTIDTTLNNLTVSLGKLTPDFVRTTRFYADTVDTNVASVTVRGVASDSTETIFMSNNGTFTQSDSAVVILKEGAVTIMKVRVKNVIGDSLDYTVGVYRKAAGAVLDTGSFRDLRDGQVYRTVKIGTQTWMAQNLNFKPTGLDSGWCYDNKSENCFTYGRLYNWSAVMAGESSSTKNPSGVQGICPKNWHVPSDAEWTTLVNQVETNLQVGSGYGGTGLKSTSGWLPDGTTPGSGTDLVGFHALPGGSYNGESFNTFGTNAFFWTATVDEASNAWYLELNNLYPSVYHYGNFQTYGFSLRCLAD